MPANLSSRLNELENYLARQRTQKEIAEHFGVDRKTVRRAIDKLSQFAGITEEKDGRHTVYSIPENDYNSPHFTSIELAALVLSQKAILAGGAFSHGSPFASAGRSLIEKVQAKMPLQIKRRLEELSQIIGSAAVPTKDYSEFGGVIEELTTAAVERRTVSMLYVGLSSRRKEERLFDPYNIYLDPDGATLKTIGYDHKNSRISPFSLDRILRIKITKEKFERLENFILSKFLEDNCFNGIHNPPVRVRLRACGTTASVFAERTFHPSQKTLAVKKSKASGVEQIEVEMTVAGGRGLQRFILSWLPEIEVVSPDSLRAEIRAVIAESKI